MRKERKMRRKSVNGWMKSVNGKLPCIAILKCKL